MRVRHRHNHTPSFILVPLRVTPERNQAAAIVFLARANKGRHLLPRHQAIGMMRVASSDMSVVYCYRVLSCQNGPALSSTSRNLWCRIIDHPRNVQKHKNRATSSEEVGPLPEASPAPADHSYDHAEGDCFSSFEPGPSGASDIACEGGQSPISPQAIINHYPTSAHTTISKESHLALIIDSRSVTPETKPCMVRIGGKPIDDMWTLDLNNRMFCQLLLRAILTRYSCSKIAPCLGVI